MGTRFRPYQPKQLLLLSPDLREWVPEGHLAHPNRACASNNPGEVHRQRASAVDPNISL